MKYLILGLAGLVLAGVAQAQAVEAEGSAVISGPVGVAKRMAMQDAIRQALIQANARLSTTTVVSAQGVVTDNMRFSAQGRVTNVEILNEWTDESNYYVKIRAQVPTGPAEIMAEGQAGATAMLSNGDQDPAGRYRRKVGISQFHVADRTQIHDLPKIEVELARELERRLNNDARVISVDASQYLLPLAEGDIVSQRRIIGALPPAREPEQVATEFAESLGVQFIVSGVLRNMGTSSHFLGGRVRHLELDLLVHDGVTGAVVARHRLSDSVEEGSLMGFPASQSVMNEKFFATPFGQKVDQLVDKMVGLVAGDVMAQPFTARVIRSQDNQVYFDAGGLAQVKVGDVLSTYQLTQSQVRDLAGQRALGFSEKPTSTLVVTQVQRLFAVGTLEPATARLAPGDVIRFEP